MSIRNLIQGASAGAVPATVPAQGVDLDGLFDYLSRSTDLTGNVDSKTFTFSAWVYGTFSSAPMIYTVGDGVNFHRFQIYFVSSAIIIYGWNISGVKILDASVSITPPIYTFNNILISIDLANTANRQVYLNDILQTVTWVTYSNDSISFTETTHTICAGTTGSNKLKGRLSNVFLDYTYRDLSIEANRRIFTVDA